MNITISWIRRPFARWLKQMSFWNGRRCTAISTARRACRSVNGDRRGFDVLLDIDTQGAAQIRQRDPGAVSIYLLPPSLAVLRQRLQNRQSDTSEEIARRLKKAKEEVKAYKEYKYVVINDDFKTAYKELEAIVLAERNSTGALDLSSLEQALTGTEEEY